MKTTQKNNITLNSIHITIMMYIILNINVKKITCSLKVHKRQKKVQCFHSDKVQSTIFRKLI